MENTTTKKSLSLNCGSVIKPLSIIALVCMVLFICLISLWVGWDDPYNEFDGIFFLLDLSFVILTLSPVILFVLYIFKFHSKRKAPVLVPVIFGIIGLKATFNFFFNDYLRLQFGTGFLWYHIEEIYRIWRIYHILDLAIFVCAILAVINILKGFNKKTFIILSMSICLLRETLFLIEIFEALILNYYIGVNSLAYLIAIIGSIALYIALLLFDLKNRISFVLPPEKEKARVAKMDPEQALKLLKDKLDLDMITEEEYQAQRAEIISKL